MRESLVRQGASHAKLAAAEQVLDPEAFTIGFARRFATYKRANLIFRDIERVKRLLRDRERPVQIIFAGKAHPQDQPGKELIRQIVQLAKKEDLQNSIVFLEDYDIDVARYLVQGVDVWLNTPRRPLEASGTSGMKAALNGTLNVSILDGWWVEGYTGDNGWAIGSGEELADRDYQDWVESEMLYDLLEKEVIPMFYDRRADDVPREWIRRMKACVRTCGPQFNTNRMVQEYTEKMYFPASIQSSTMRRDSFSVARDLAAWKSRLRDRWNEVDVLSVDGETSRELEVGSDLELTVKVRLGALSPEEVAAEVLYGPLDSQEEIVGSESLRLDCGRVEEGVAVFTGQVPCREAGQHGFAIRVVPYRRELADRFSTGLITWWTGGARVVSGAVHAGV